METEKLGTKDGDGHQHWRARMIAGDGRDVVFTTMGMGMSGIGAEYYRRPIGDQRDATHCISLRKYSAMLDSMI
jgi:hypothetical protein